MTTQERINQLAQAALRSAPSSTAGIPRPATFMPSFEKLRSPEFFPPDRVRRDRPVSQAVGEATVPVAGMMPGA